MSFAGREEKISLKRKEMANSAGLRIEYIKKPLK
jgi:hypothetical protein